MRLFRGVCAGSLAPLLATPTLRLCSGCILLPLTAVELVIRVEWVWPSLREGTPHRLHPAGAGLVHIVWEHFEAVDDSILLTMHLPRGVQWPAGVHPFEKVVVCAKDVVFAMPLLFCSGASHSVFGRGGHPAPCLVGHQGGFGLLPIVLVWSSFKNWLGLQGLVGAIQSGCLAFRVEFRGYPSSSP